MPASTYEYKTVALPQIVQGKRKRGVSEADIVAETFGEVIHLEAVDGWEYMRADVLAAGTRGGMFSKEPVVTHYSVLVFRRTLESAWPMHRDDAQSERVQPAAAPSSASSSSSSSSSSHAPSQPVVDASAPAVPSAPVRPRPAPVAPRSPIAPAAPAPAPAAPARAAPAPSFTDPTSPLAQGMVLSTGGRFRSEDASPSSSSGSSAPRPPLGSAQD